MNGQELRVPNKTQKRPEQHESKFDAYEDLSKLSARIYQQVNPADGSRQIGLDGFLPAEIQPFGERRTYGQNWAAYDEAKTNEDGLFKQMLQELLLLAVPDDPLPKKGRKPFGIRERLFCMCVKVYYRSDLRKAESILKELKRLHYIDRVPCFKSLDNFFNDGSLSIILDELILLTALPLAGLEDTGAIDSTGFSTSKFDRWFNYKWGKPEGKERRWRKAHAVSGCKTNTILSVEVTKKNVGDAKMFEKVVGDKTKYFDMQNFVADKAYSSRRIMNFLHELNLLAYIPFKKNARGTKQGSLLWAEMFQHFNRDRDRFMKVYHRRSNVETCFHMVKQRFGDNVRTRTMNANVNEIKVKFLCHNICVLIQEAFESNISVNFEECVKTTAAV